MLQVHMCEDIWVHANILIAAKRWYLTSTPSRAFISMPVIAGWGNSHAVYAFCISNKPYAQYVGQCMSYVYIYKIGSKIIACNIRSQDTKFYFNPLPIS